MPSLLPPENAEPSKMKHLSSGPLGVAKIMIGMFSTSTCQRDPPNENKTSHIRLITIAASHFCEKARWALDMLESRDDNPYYYTEYGHPPPFQGYETLKASGEKASITPMVVFHENGKEQVLYDSTRILQKLMPELYPEEINADVERLEAELGERLGASVRGYAYYNLLSQIDKFHQSFVKLTANKNMVANVESILVDKFLPNGLANGIMKALKINQESADASLQAIRNVFDEMSKRLQDSGGEYLLDTKEKSYGFTAADLTFSSLAYPILRPPEMKFWLLEQSEVPAEINNLTEELRATKAGQHVLKMYEKHRLSRGEIEAVMKKAIRDKYPWQKTGWFGAVGLLGLVSAVGVAVAFSRSKRF